ncbi:hypothetical protein GQ600_21601 [Phytophthora cactorum]|nr:hypothetical protein GQ600_21601 [Phytophthora cactorum]
MRRHLLLQLQLLSRCFNLWLLLLSCLQEWRRGGTISSFTDDVWSGPPQAARFSMPSEPAPQPKPALSDLLSKKSRLPHEDPELFGADNRSNPTQQGNPFQTASERLQGEEYCPSVIPILRLTLCVVRQNKHDRMTGRVRNIDDDQPRSRNDRRGNPRGPHAVFFTL